MIGKFFKHRIKSVVGIYFDGENIYAAELRLQPTIGDVSRIVENDEVIDVDYVFEVDKPIERWTVRGALESRFDALEIGDDLKIRAEKLAEKVAAICSTQGWSTDVTALCLDRNEVVTVSDDFSKIPSNEVVNAVRYQIAAAGSFDIDGFHAAYVEHEGRVWMEGIAKNDARVRLDAWRKNDMELAVLTALPNGFDATAEINVDGVEMTSGLRNAIGAARIAAFQTSPNFLSGELERIGGWDFRKFAAAVAACTLIGLTTLFALDHRHHEQAIEALTLEREQLEELDRDRSMKSLIERDLEKLGDRNRLLATLSKETFPWRSVLIHFGTLHVDGVWLNEIKSASDKSIEIKGEAVSYEAMSEFISTLEEDDDFFKHEPEIRSSSAASGGKTVEFVVRIPMI